MGGAVADGVAVGCDGGAVLCPVPDVEDLLPLVDDSVDVPLESSTDSSTGSSVGVEVSVDSGVSVGVSVNVALGVTVSFSVAVEVWVASGSNPASNVQPASRAINEMARIRACFSLTGSSRQIHTGVHI
jgi:hypothetical protein